MSLRQRRGVSAEPPSWPDISPLVVTASGCSQGDESLWKRLSGPLVVCVFVATDLMYSRYRPPRGASVCGTLPFNTCCKDEYLMLKQTLVVLLFWSLESSYFAVNEGSHCEMSCNALLWVKLLFNDVRCHKINILFLAQRHVPQMRGGAHITHMNTHSCGRLFLHAQFCLCVSFSLLGHLIWRTKFNSI